MKTLSDIEQLTLVFAAGRTSLIDRVADLEAEIAAAKRKRLPAIKRLVEKTANARSELQTAIEESPELFRRPRTVIFHNVKVGFGKAKGKIKIENADLVVRLIRKHLSEQAETLIKTVETPVKAALNMLSGADLKRIGVTVIDAGDQVVIKPTDSDIEKLVEALLAEQADCDG